MNPHNGDRVAVGVVGATGYTGLEVLRVLARHDGVDIRFATSEREAGGPSGIPGLALIPADDAPLDSVDVVFLCLPHGQAAAWAPRALAAGARVVDLTADHRPGSGNEDGAVYGMADLVGERVATARLVANPGCYPTGVQLALHALQAADVLDSGRTVVVNAASGVTGAGRSPKRDLLFAEVAGEYRAYATGNEHRHLREMRHGLPGLELIFQPHLLPLSRGILETMYVPVRPGIDAQAVRQTWASAYGALPTIRVFDPGVPGLADVVGTDVLALGAADNAGVPGTVTVVAALDNLGKGAAGQAVQNMNLMFGFDPVRGLRC
ncbi:MAG: N-acetyl-gamma-glutamyl-phosphate reductase [Longimicrobiales bacterium]